MNPLKSISALIYSLKDTFNSHYWEYSKYYKDGEVWEDAFLFESFGGADFQGNPYYIYKELLKRDDVDKYRIYISAKNPETIKISLGDRDLLRSNVSVIEVHTAEYRNVLSHAKYLVNNVSFTMDFVKKDGQIYLNTWHGTPLKTLGRTVLGDPFAVQNAQRNYLLSDYLIAPNRLTKSVYENDHMIHDIMSGEVILAGYPRNSVFFDKKAADSVREKYELKGYKTVFYMPTWRGNTCGVDKVDQVEDIERLAKDLGEGYKVFVKFHPAMGRTSGDFRYCYNMPGDIEVYEFLNAMDILITDYSSVFFDFASTGKKIVLYQYDREEYYKSRGVYHEIEDNINFPVAYDYRQLYNTVINDDNNDYSKFAAEYCPYDSISAAKESLELLFNDKKQDNLNEPVNLYIIDRPITEGELERLKEGLIGTNYRFVFVLNRRSRGYSEIHSWSTLDYIPVNTYNKLSLVEKIDLFFCNLLKTKKTKSKLDYYGRREQRRLFGNMRIGNVYTRSSLRSLPVALRYIAKQER